MNHLFLPLRYKFTHYITTIDGYEVDSYEWFTIPDTTLTLYINYGITLVMVNNRVLTYLSLMLEGTCSIASNPICFDSRGD